MEGPLEEEDVMPVCTLMTGQRQTCKICQKPESFAKEHLIDPRPRGTRPCNVPSGHRTPCSSVAGGGRKKIHCLAAFSTSAFSIVHAA